MAEAILRARAGDRFESASAGMKPKGIHPLTLRVLSEADIETRGLRSKPTSEFLGEVAVRHAIIVCEQVNQHCPSIFPFATRTHYWPFDDPAAFEGTEAERLDKFRTVRDEIAQRIDAWLGEVDRT